MNEMRRQARGIGRRIPRVRRPLSLHVALNAALLSPRLLKTAPALPDWAP